MALSRSAIITLKERAHTDPKFCKELVKELIRLAIASDPELVEKALEKVDKK